MWMLLAAMLVLGTGCAGTGVRLAGMDLVMKPEQIIDLNKGAPVEYNRLVSGLRPARVIFLGEFHTHKMQHEHQLEIIKSLWQANRKLAIGLELFERDRQGFLDRWIAGEIPEDMFTREVLKNDFNHSTLAVYYPLLLWARAHQVPLLALNAPRTITAQIAKSGLGSLTREQKGQIAADIVLGPPEYRERVLTALGHHQMPVDPDNFFAAQVTWDETMAESLAKYLTSPAGVERQVVVIAGNEHVYHGYGIPGRLERRVPVSEKLLLMLVSTEDEVLTPEIADYVWITAPDPGQARPRLGIVLDQTDSGLKVAKVLEDSEAQRVGLAVGDRILTMDGLAVNSPMDLHRAAVRDVPDGQHLLTVERQGRTMEFRIKFRKMKTPMP